MTNVVDQHLSFDNPLSTFRNALLSKTVLIVAVGKLTLRYFSSAQLAEIADVLPSASLVVVERVREVNESYWEGIAST